MLVCLVPEWPASQSLAWGSMRMLEVNRSETEWLDFLSEAHSLGFDSLHSSNEYESFPLLSSLLHSGTKRPSFPVFRHIAKLAEPSFDDHSFAAARLEAKIHSYLAALSTPVLHNVQWMWRHNLQLDSQRISDFQRQLDAIADAVGRLKRAGLIERFFCFPYSVEFGRVALEHEAIDGLVVYRNVQETEYDALIDRSAALSKLCHIIRPFNAGTIITQAKKTPEDVLKFAMDKPAIKSAILSSNSIEHLRELAMVVRRFT